MQDQDAASAEAVHQTYERQVAETNAARVDDLWARIEAVVGTGAGRPRASRQERGLTVTDPASGRTLRFVMDDVLDLPEDQRPGPFGMGNARVTMTAWDGTRRAWLLRNVTAGGIDYQWVTLPGDVAVGDEVIAALVAGLTSGEMPPDPAETVHMDATTAASATLATGDRWAIYNETA
ncbi:MAG: hypothetical protein NVSMB65_15610 [Chloroflexota bacterium]